MTTQIKNLLNQRIRVVVFSKNQMSRESLKCLIEANGAYIVTGMHSFCERIDRVAVSSRADVAVMNFHAGDRIEIISEARRHIQNIRVVAIVESDDLESQSDALRSGAVGIVQKNQSAKQLIDAIRQTFHGETWLNQVLLNRILQKDSAKSEKLLSPWQGMRGDTLTPRELEVIMLVGEGLKNKKIAERLYISEATVRHHLSSIYGKIGVDDRLNLIIFAYRTGILSVPNDSSEVENVMV